MTHEYATAVKWTGNTGQGTAMHKRQTFAILDTSAAQRMSYLSDDEELAVSVFLYHRVSIDSEESYDEFHRRTPN